MREPCLCRAADGNNVDEYRGRPGLSLDADGPAQEEVPDLLGRNRRRGYV